MEHDPRSKQADQLVFSGFLLFLIGLVLGLFVGTMANPRMALSAHLEGIMNGMFLVLLGLVWKRLLLSQRLLRLTLWLAVYGTFANLLAVGIAAVTGYGRMLPIAGGQEGPGPVEGVISFILVTLSLCMLSVTILVLVGYYKHMRRPVTE